MMETILCPTDFSPRSEMAIRYADELAQRMNSRIVLLHTIFEPVGADFISYGGLSLPYAPPYRDPVYWQEQLDKLNALKEELQETDWAMPVSYETRIKYGETKETIPQAAQEVQADLIVLGAEGEAGISGLMQESAVAEVIRNASCPVLLIPPKTSFRPIHRIVFATDLEGEPFTDVAFVSKLASLFEARILFLHILTEDQPQSRQQAQGELDRLHKRLPYKNATFYSQTNPDIEAGINQFTRRHKADMLVMGYHPRSFWDRLFRPDYTGDIAAHASLPMLVIHYKH